MDANGWTVADVARVAEVTPSAVSQWLGNGKSTHRIASISTAVRLQNATGYSALWIAEGEGEKRLNILVAREPAKPWPLPIVDEERYRSLPASQQFAAQAAMLQKIEEAEAELGKHDPAHHAALQSTLLTGT